MVLFKRKPISFVDPPDNVDPNAEVWIMRGSEEVFTNYEEYLERYDYYSQPHFTDAVNGKSGMTFFKALESEVRSKQERKESAKIKRQQRRQNASTSDIERIFPEALRAPILRKVQHSQINRMDDLINHVYDEFAHDFFPGEEVTAALDDGEKVECVVREKANFPELRNPDGTIQRPAFSRYFVKLQASDEEALTDGDHISRRRNIFTKANIRSFLKNCLIREAWIGAPWQVKDTLAQQYRLPLTIPSHLTQAAVKANQAALNSPAMKGKKQVKRGLTVDQLLQQEIDQQIKGEAERPDAPKYPTEDLDLEPSSHGSIRPRLQFLAPLDGPILPDAGLSMDSVGPLLEIWNALNVHWDVYEIDAFSFDDFVDAIKFTSPNVSCELFEEMHCGILKTLIDTDGELQVKLPELQAADEMEEDEIEVDSGPASPQPVSTRPSRSRLSQVQNVEEHPTLDDKSRKSHKAQEMLEERSWIDRLKARDLADGGWQIIMVGIIHQLSLDKIWTSRCEPILEHLAPASMPATQFTAQQQYEDLDVNLRVMALYLLTMLSMSSQTIRMHLETRGEDMTLIRKQKVETQRTRKEHLKDLQRLELDRAEANPDAYLSDEDAPVKTEDDTVMTNGHDETLSTITDASDDDAPKPLRRSNNIRKRKRDEEVARRETARLAALSAQKDTADKLKRYKKILRDIEAAKKRVSDCERAIETFDLRLRAMNATRMRSLGRDRFWNRYWYFERIGHPLDGTKDPHSHKKQRRVLPFANARIWVQGPDALTREGFIDVLPADAAQYTARHGMSVAARKVAEEGALGVRSAEQWGFYDSPDELDALLGWLDERGVRERELRKEILAWREELVAAMTRRLEALHPPADAGDEENGEEVPRTRVSTRHKTYLDEADVEKHWRVLQWRNTSAATKSGRHVEVKGRKAAVVGKKGVAQRVVSGGRSAAKEAAAAIAESAAKERRAIIEAAGGGRRGLRSTR